MFVDKTQTLALVITFNYFIVICVSYTTIIQNREHFLNDSTEFQQMVEKLDENVIQQQLIDSTDFTNQSPESVTKIKKGSRFKPNVYPLKKRLVIKTSSGFVEGKTLKVFGSTVYTFLGIPYAEPPKGQLRFAKPKPIKPWVGIKPTMSFGAMCPQKIIARNLVPMKYITENTDEDCLTINIWSPDIRPKTLKTVMIWIHGGGFQFNTANLYDTEGSVLSSNGDVVVVSLNYRIGVLGFLNIQTPSAPGNMGIYDQSLALHWIKQNIAKFGGDPKKLVPFGQSAGAISIGILMTMNSTKKLFSRAITSSGGALLPELLTAKTVKNSKKFTKLIGCATNREYKEYHENIVQCLRRKPLNQLIEVQGQILDSSHVAFIPNSDGYYNDIILPGNLLDDKKLFSNMKEMLTGVVSNEGSFLMHSLAPQEFGRHTYPILRTLDETRSMCTWYLTQKMGYSRKVASLISSVMITGPKTDKPINNVKRITQAFGDNALTCPTFYMADVLSARNKTVYMYLYDHRSKSTKVGEWMGVTHYEEVPFVFGYPLRKPKIFSKEDIKMSKRIIKIWSHFAKTGKVLSQFGQNWPKYNRDEPFMVLKANHSLIINGFHQKNCEIFEAITDYSNTMKNYARRYGKTL